MPNEPVVLDMAAEYPLQRRMVTLHEAVLEIESRMGCERVDAASPVL